MPYVLMDDGVKIYYEIHGEGEPVALLNGIFMNTEGWLFQTMALSKKYRVILHDFRGQWKSDLGRDFRLDMHIEDFKKLLKYLNVDRANLVGTSYGGLVALNLALRYPSLVKSLVLINVPINPILRQMGEKWLQACQTRDPEKFVDSWIDDVYSKEFLNIYDKNLFRRTLIERYRNFNFEAGIVLLKQAIQLSDNLSLLLASLKQITVPTLIIASDKDVLGSLETAIVFQREIPSSELKVVRGAGHAVIIERPQEVNTLILEFLDRLLTNSQR